MDYHMILESDSLSAAAALLLAMKMNAMNKEWVRNSVLHYGFSLTTTKLHKIWCPT